MKKRTTKCNAPFLVFQKIDEASRKNLSINFIFNIRYFIPKVNTLCEIKRKKFKK